MAGSREGGRKKRFDVSKKPQLLALDLIQSRYEKIRGRVRVPSSHSASRSRRARYGLVIISDHNCPIPIEGRFRPRVLCAGGRLARASGGMSRRSIERSECRKGGKSKTSERGSEGASEGASERTNDDDYYDNDAIAGSAPNPFNFVYGTREERSRVLPAAARLPGLRECIATELPGTVVFASNQNGRARSRRRRAIDV